MLEQHIKPGSLLVGVGNTLCGDDGFGPLVIKLLQGKTSLSLLDAGSAPENSLGKIGKLAPSEIIFIDAISLEASAGSLHWIEPDELEHLGISTHAPSLDLLVSFIKQNNQNAQVHLVGTVPVQVGFGTAMSDEVRQAAEELVGLISTLYPPPGPSEPPIE